MIRPLLYFAFMSFLTGCLPSMSEIDPGKVTRINIIDRNGLSETISSKERLNAFKNTDFLSSQPYQKVMRVYEREKNGNVHACVTSYHPNGQIKQYLEAVNNRALGPYREWFANGQLKVEANVIGGMADLNTQAEESWLFEGINCAWDEEGQLAAKITYEKGELKKEDLYSPGEKLLQSTHFLNGMKEGISTRYWNPEQIAFEETYRNGILENGTYFNAAGEVISEIVHGRGLRPVFGMDQILELQEFCDGRQEGEVRVFDEAGSLSAQYRVQNGEKEGEETVYMPGTSQLHLSLYWHEGVLQGTMKTWYENGRQESQREMCNNKKNGLLTAWFQNGELMMVEEYDDDKLVKGEYYRKGELAPLSKVEKGKGVVTLFTEEGNFSKKINYEDGFPIE